MIAKLKKRVVESRIGSREPRRRDWKEERKTPKGTANHQGKAPQRCRHQRSLPAAPPPLPSTTIHDRRGRRFLTNFCCRCECVYQPFLAFSSPIKALVLQGFPSSLAVLLLMAVSIASCKCPLGPLFLLCHGREMGTLLRGPQARYVCT